MRHNIKFVKPCPNTTSWGIILCKTFVTQLVLMLQKTRLLKINGKNALVKWNFNKLKNVFILNVTYFQNYNYEENPPWKHMFVFSFEIYLIFL